MTSIIFMCKISCFILHCTYRTELVLYVTYVTKTRIICHDSLKKWIHNYFLYYRMLVFTKSNPNEMRENLRTIFNIFHVNKLLSFMYSLKKKNIYIISYYILVLMTMIRNCNNNITISCQFPHFFHIFLFFK